MKRGFIKREWSHYVTFDQWHLWQKFLWKYGLFGTLVHPQERKYQLQDIYLWVILNHGVRLFIINLVGWQNCFSFLILFASCRYSCAQPDLTFSWNFCHRRGKRTFLHHCVVPLSASSDFLSLWKTFHTGCSWMWRRMGSEHGHALCAVWGFSQKRRISHIVHTSTSHFWWENECPQCVSAYFPLF